jgi:hypothetical protein
MEARMSTVELLLPFTPVALYLLAFCFYAKKLVADRIETRRHSVLDVEMNGSLTLVGFSVTILGILLAIGKELPAKFISIYHITLSISFFLLSYVLYFLRLREAFIFFAGCMRNAGIWTLVSSMAYLASGYGPALAVLIVLLALFTLYIVIDILFIAK